ncbi:maleylpyruvate isomerase family mycothiol-dependent enzyme, partial [Isoptericola sp. NPDC060257]
NDAAARRAGRRPVAETVTLLRERAESRFSPPMTGPRAPLTDLLVHEGDMRLPLGLAHDPDPETVRVGLEFVTTGHAIGFVPRGRLRGLRLAASDLDWAWGDGAALTGRGIDLLMAACGRPAVLPRLDGAGLSALAGRL